MLDRPPGIASTIIFLVEEANTNPVIVTGNTETVVIAAAGFIFGWVAQKSRVFNPGHIKHQFQFTNWVYLNQKCDLHRLCSNFLLVQQ